jgi:AcrR family transcriptional regulator
MNAPRLSADARREQILDVAIQVFGRAGYYGASMNDIADAAGVTKPVLYQHFDSKSDLYGALLDEVGARMLSSITKETANAVDGREQTVRGFRAYFRWVAHRHDEFMLLFGGSARHAEEFAGQIRGITDEAAALSIATRSPTRSSGSPRAQAAGSWGSARTSIPTKSRARSVPWRGPDCAPCNARTSRRRPPRTALARQTPDLPLKKRSSRTDQIGDVVRSSCARHRCLHRLGPDPRCDRVRRLRHT